MIIGNLEKHKSEIVNYPPALERALQYLQEHDFSKMEPGRYEIEGKDMYVNVDHYETKLIKDCYPEAHERYVDVQYMASGREYLGWCMLNPGLEIHKPYDDEKDIVFYEKLLPESICILEQGDYAILEPRDVHRPCGAIDDTPAPVIKVVVKVSTELLKKD